MQSGKDFGKTRHNNDLRESLAITSYETVLPDYNIKSMGDSCYSIIKFHRKYNLSSVHIKEEQQYNDEKLDNAFSRARSMVLQYGLSNPWEYFVTLTLDRQKYDRYNLDNFRVHLMQFIRDMRKKYKGSYGYFDRLSVLLVPEMHKDGAWHIHGLLHGIDKPILQEFKRGEVPNVLVDKGFLNWPDYAVKFGFCSCGAIRDKTSAVLYALKYINKDMESLKGSKGQHLYIPSRPLQKAVPVGSVYGYDDVLDKYLTYHGNFCSTGLVTHKDWLFTSDFDVDYLGTPLKVDDYSDIDYLEPEPSVYENLMIGSS